MNSNKLYQKGKLKDCIRTVKLKKNPPKKCSTPRRLCLKCYKSIHKNDLNYDLKVCKACDAGRPSVSLADASGTMRPARNTGESYTTEELEEMATKFDVKIK